MLAARSSRLEAYLWIMKRPILITLCILFSIVTIAQNIIQININSLPDYHVAGTDIYVAGSFNGWNPKDEKYKFKLNTNGKYNIELKLNSGKSEFKLTRGGWDKVECLEDGSPMGNRELNSDGNKIIALDIKGWADHFPSKPKQSTALKNVKVIDTAFYMPQLKRNRRIWIYLPPGYESSGKKYSVLYMHDGQNVFDDATSYAGEWGVDECLDTMGREFEECIVVAVDNGLDKRLNEYSPYDFSLSGIAVNYGSGKGEGSRYVDFLVKTLKPFVDKNYRTSKKRSNTFIAGSSMGGLISLYAALRYPKVFGGAGIFSPAFWVGPKIFDDIKSRGHKVKSRIYFYAGKLEGETMVPYAIRAFDEMHRVSKSKMELVIRAEGLHNEQRWRIEFPLFYQWILNR